MKFTGKNTIQKLNRVFPKLLLIINCLFTPLYAQDIHFSQFFSSRTVINPANTGNYDEHWRFTNNYRSQDQVITKPYVTVAACFDHQFYFYSEKISLGLLYISDRSGDGILTLNEILVSSAYHKKINGHNIHVGLQAGYALKSFNIDKLTFPTQFDMNTGQFNSDIPGGEPKFNEQVSYPDINFGFIWRKKIKIFEPEAGFSFFHLNQPNESYYGTKENLPIRSLVYLTLNTWISEGLHFEPAAIFQSQSKSNELLTGLRIFYDFNFTKMSVKSIFTGCYLRSGFDRNQDAYIVLAGIDLKKVSVGLSYDFNISKLNKQTGERMAFEVSLVYKGPDFNLVKKLINCERY